MAHSQLEGRWTQPCQLQTTREEWFRGPFVTLTENYNYRSDCSEPLMIMKNYGRYKTGGTKHIDFEFARVTITLKHDLMLQDFSSRQVCGFTDWKLEEERDVTGLRCAIITGAKPLPMASRGSRRYGIYKIEGDLLYFGRLEPGYDALSPESRPVTFDPRYYVKQP